MGTTFLKGNLTMPIKTKNKLKNVQTLSVIVLVGILFSHENSHINVQRYKQQCTVRLYHRKRLETI